MHLCFKLAHTRASRFIEISYIEIEWWSCFSGVSLIVLFHFSSILQHTCVAALPVVTKKCNVVHRAGCCLKSWYGRCRMAVLDILFATCWLEGMLKWNLSTFKYSWSSTLCVWPVKAGQPARNSASSCFYYNSLCFCCDLAWCWVPNWAGPIKPLRLPFLPSPVLSPQHVVKVLWSTFNMLIYIWSINQHLEPPLISQHIGQASQHRHPPSHRPLDSSQSACKYQTMHFQNIWSYSLNCFQLACTL